MNILKRCVAMLTVLVVAMVVSGCSSGGGSDPSGPTPIQFHWVYFTPPTGGIWTYRVESAISPSGKIVGVRIDGVDAEIDPASVVRFGFYWKGLSGLIGENGPYRGEPIYFSMTKTEATGIWGYELADGRMALMDPNRVAIVGKSSEIVGEYIHYYD